MIWLYIALTAYLINAFVFVIDKYLLAGPIPKPYAYAFGVSILSLTAIFLIPFGVVWQGYYYFLISIICGASFFGGIIFLYKSIRTSDVSVAATQVGTMGGLFTYLLSIFILGETLSSLSLYAFVFLILGIFLLGRLEKKVFTSTLIAGLLMAFYFVLLKLSFDSAGFINGLFWTRLGFIGSALGSLIFKKVREDIGFSFSYSSRQSKYLFVFNKVLAGVGFIVLYFAIQLGSVSLVNALLGVQFLFIFFIVLLFGRKLSRLGIVEKMSKKALLHKSLGIASVLVGVFLLFIR